MSAPALAPRLLRAAVFTAVCVVLSALGHALAACAGIALWTFVAGFLGVFALTFLFAGRQRSLPAIAGALTGGQLLLHALFGLGQTTLATAGGRGGLGPEANDALIRMAAKLVCGAGATSLSPADATRILTDAGLDPAHAAGRSHAHGAHGSHLAATAGPGTELLPSLPMFLGHLLAALATGWLLRRGDLALSRLVRLSADGATGLAEGALVRSLRAALAFVRALLAGLPATPAAGPHRPGHPFPDTPPPTAARALQHSVIRRGPPAACVLAA
ncbi:hypothetical protein EAO71_18670 [Streptomyces sp. ms191]|uniref:hypothetical protein n=1 Tax=Streptomyces sp. ms191 TaxID=1827978 RepID=UPI0011CDFBC5|nr:hypothetical protein [Streptomyces sp. ms191]TXS30474.1 hypothetical protein EAO71_18670 [Streptomyces sp. ms191]